MEPAGELLITLGKTFGLMLLTLAVLGIGGIVFLDIWAKRHTAGSLYAIFLEQRHLFSKLLKIENDKVYMGRGDNKEEYLLDTTKQFWAWWPPGLPKMVQVPVRTHWYVRNVPEPLDPENIEATISSRSLRLISDESMLRSTWKDIRESIGAGAPVRQGGSIALIVVFAVLAVTGFNLYLTMQLKTMLGG